MTIEKHIERIKQKYSNDKKMQLSKLLGLALQIGLGYGAKQLLKNEIHTLWEQGVRPAELDVISVKNNDSCIHVKDCMSLVSLENIVHSTIAYIQQKYPNEHNTQDRWMTLLIEEIGELGKAINDGDINNYIEELTQCIAALYLMGLDFCKKQNCMIQSSDIYSEDCTQKIIK